MNKTARLLSTILVTMTLINPLGAATRDSTGTRVRTLQISLVTPIGSNGFNSWNITNKFSINLLAGYAGGVDGVEFSGLGSVLRTRMRGVQFSGLGSIVLQETTGAQFAGLANYNAGAMKGFQAAGMANFAIDTMKGLQLAGFFNFTKGEKVTQVGGFANINAGNNKGAQIAGFININSGKLTGLQLAGFMNYTRKLKGTQLGVINYVDSLEKGVPVGFLSFVKNGYSAFEIGATESLYGVASFKTGVKQFYNILSVGGGYRDGLSLFAWGYGAGTVIPVGQRVGISIDGICYQVNEGEWFTDRLNLLNKLNISVSFLIARHLTIYGGLSWNVAVSDITDEYGDPVTPHIAPWSVFEETFDDHLNVKMYPGISAGIRL